MGKNNDRNAILEILVDINLNESVTGEQKCKPKKLFRIGKEEGIETIHNNSQSKLKYFYSSSKIDVTQNLQMANNDVNKFKKYIY